MEENSIWKATYILLFKNPYSTKPLSNTIPKRHPTDLKRRATTKRRNKYVTHLLDIPTKKNHKLHYWLNKLRQFSLDQIGSSKSCIVVEFHRGGSATNGATLYSFSNRDKILTTKGGELYPKK